jgi:hypothetical protein
VLHAQVVGGSISGTVSDPSGALIPNAHVVIRNEDTGTQRTLVTGATGNFTAPSLPVGSYTIAVEASGFAHFARKGVTLTVGQSLSLNLALAVSGAETVDVQSTPQTVNTSTEQVSGLVDSRQVKELPLNGRSYDQLLSLNPGTVNSTNQRSGGTGTSNSSVGNMFSISGRRPQDNLFLLNGIEYTGASLINVTPGGTSGQLLGIDGIREFNVVADTYSAAYGKRDGAQISIVTTGGTNALHGSVFEFARNSFFDARNYFDGTRIPEFQRNDFGGAIGGPICKDKAFFFANYEGYRQNLGESLVTLVPDSTSRAKAVASVKPLLNLWPIANGPEILSNGASTGIAEYIGTAPQHIREDFGTTRFDENLSANDNLNLIYTVDDSTASTPSSDPYSYVSESLREQVLSAQEQHIFSRVVNVARAGYSRSSFYFYGYVPAAEQALTPQRSHRSPHLCGRHRRLHRLERCLVHHHRRSQRRLEQRHRPQPLHLRRSRVSDDRPAHHPRRHLGAAPAVERQPRARSIRPGVLRVAQHLPRRNHQDLYLRPRDDGTRLAHALRRRVPRRHLSHLLAARSPRRLPQRVLHWLERDPRPRRRLHLHRWRHQYHSVDPAKRPHRQPRALPARTPRGSRVERLRQRQHQRHGWSRTAPLAARRPRLSPGSGRALQHGLLLLQHHRRQPHWLNPTGLAVDRRQQHRDARATRLRHQGRAAYRVGDRALRLLQRFAQLPPDPERRPE